MIDRARLPEHRLSTPLEAYVGVVQGSTVEMQAALIRHNGSGVIPATGAPNVATQTAPEQTAYPQQVGVPGFDQAVQRPQMNRQDYDIVG